jgi:arylsulfatase A-like enzyme
LILLDDLGWADPGCYGSTFHETPNIDRLASDGVRFTDAYSAGPVCAPTRAAILTGKNPTRLGLDRMLPPGRGRLPLEEVIIAEVLKDAGYATFFAGKWHLGGVDYYPDRQGFDVNLGGTEWSQPPSGYFSPYDISTLPDGPAGEYLTDRLTREAVGFIEAHADTPFFLMLSHYAVHAPIEGKDDLVAKYTKKAAGVTCGKNIELIDGVPTCTVQNNPTYAAMIESVDIGVGMIMDALERLGLVEDTLVIFTSDNGGESIRGAVTSNEPLRYGKGWLYEGGIRVPLIIRGAGVEAKGGVAAEPVCSYDLFPTILEAAGLPTRPDLHIDGMSLMPVVSGTGTLGREALFWNYLTDGDKGPGPSGAVRKGNMKLIQFFTDDRVRLYDLARDIGERKDLSEKRPGETSRLLEELEAWRSELNARTS